MKRILWEIIGFSLLAAGISHLFMLHVVGSILVWVTGLFLLPVVNLCGRRWREAEAEYYDVTTYMEQILCSYKRLGTLVPALEDCVSLYSEEDRMGQVLQQALCVLKTGEGVEDDNIVEMALAVIHRQYPSRRLYLLHEFLGKAEKLGGDISDSLDILLHDLQMWKRRVSLYQKKKRFLCIECTFAVVMAAGICYLSHFLMPAALVGSMTSSLIYQCSTVSVLVLLLIVETITMYKLTGTWLDSGKTLTEKQKRKQEKNYQTVKKNSAGIVRYMAKKVCRSAVEKEFPYWLLSVTLYLQTESIFQAIRQSVEQVKGVFRLEVTMLLEQMYENPSSLRPFTSFFQELNIPEVQSGMKILYSVNTNGYQETGKQIRFLVEQNNIVMDKCESNQFDSQIAGMGLWKQIPMAIAGIKVVIDMLVFLLLTMRSVSYMI